MFGAIHPYGRDGRKGGRLAAAGDRAGGRRLRRSGLGRAGRELFPSPHGGARRLARPTSLPRSPETYLHYLTLEKGAIPSLDGNGDLLVRWRGQKETDGTVCRSACAPILARPGNGRAARMKLLRTIRLDPSDTFVFERAAEPGEWAVSGAFAFADIDAAKLEGKARAAFRSGFLGMIRLAGRRWCRSSRRATRIARVATELCPAACRALRCSRSFYGAPGCRGGNRLCSVAQRSSQGMLAAVHRANTRTARSAKHFARWCRASGRSRFAPTRSWK